MKKFLVVLIFLFLAVTVSATVVNVTIVSDEVYTGAILRLRSLGSEELGDPYYPYFIGDNIGIIKFEIETGLSDVNMSLRFTTDSELSLKVEEGHFAINGSEIIIDYRKINETITERITTLEEVVIENDSEIDKEDAMPIEDAGLTGYVSRDKDTIQSNVYILFGLGVLFMGIAMFFVVRKAYTSGAEKEIKLLGRLEIDRKIDELDKR